LPGREYSSPAIGEAKQFAWNLNANMTQPAAAVNHAAEKFRAWEGGGNRPATGKFGFLMPHKKTVALLIVPRYNGDKSHVVPSFSRGGRRKSIQE
jgi:hypothetical protein